MKNHETRAWRNWKITCYTVMVIALLVTVSHLVLGPSRRTSWPGDHSV